MFIKRFIFEFTDCQLYLIYIGIYQRDIANLRFNLIGLFMVDEIRRVLLESVVPYLLQNKDRLKKEVEFKLLKKSTISKEGKQNV